MEGAEGTGRERKQEAEGEVEKEKPKNTQCVLTIAQTPIEIDLPRKAYCCLCTDTVSYGTDTVSYGSSGQRGLPVLCSVLRPASNFGVLCCTATRAVLIHCAITRTTFSELLQALCCSAIVFNIIRAVISLLPYILWCHSLLTLGILFHGTSITTILASLFWMLSLASCWQLLLPT